MKIELSLLRRIALGYVCLPMVVFLVGWTRPAVWSVALLISLAMVFLLEKDKSCRYRLPQSGFEGTAITLPLFEFMLVVLVAVIWCVICGQGGFVCQKGDWAARNAIFRDLLTHSWPVMYPKVNGALCYYVGFWLPAAAAGKVAHLVSGSQGVAWTVGNLALLAWSVVGVCLTWFVLMISAGMQFAWKRWMLIAVFILIGGLDIVGYLLKQFYLAETGEPVVWSGLFHLDNRWILKPHVEFSSLTTLMSWVFNQSVVSWVGTALVLTTRSIRHLGLVVFPLLICGPFPTVGLCVIVALVIGKCVIDGHVRVSSDVIRDAFSSVNVMSALVFAVPAVLYLTANMNSGQIAVCRNWTMGWGLTYVYICILEFGCFALLLRRRLWGNAWVLASFLLMVLCQLLYVGDSRDFGMRAVIPAFLIVVCYVVREMESRRPTWFLICLLIGAVGPIGELTDTVLTTRVNFGRFWASRQTYGIWPDFHLYQDNGTYDRPQAKLDGIWKWYVYFAKDPEDKIFYRYLARRRN